MIVTIVILPLLSALFSGFLGNYVGRIGSIHVTVLGMILTTAVTLFYLSQTTLLNEAFYFNGGS